MVKSPVVRSLAALLIIFSIWTTANAVPLVLSHQGRLLDASDAPLSGTYTIVYSIYDAPVGGTQLWMEDHVGVVVTDGLFSVLLGSTVPLSADIVAGSGGGGGGGLLRYLQVQISGQPPIMPRTQLVSSPYSLATERVSGDFHSGPGVVVMGDTTGNVYARFGERVQAGVHAAGSALASGAALIKEECDDGDADIAMSSKGSGNRVLAIQNGTTPDAVSSSMSIDDDGDTVPESEIESIVVPGTCSVAINTKGTGADKGRTIGSSCDDSSAVQVLELDDDGDGIVEGRGIISVKSASGSGSMSASSRLSCDPDEDGDPDGDISQIVTPTTCSVAIKTKGTGADRNRTIGSSCDDSLTINYLDMDDDGDGISEARAVSAVSSLSGAGSGAAAASYARWFVDSDDDGVPEGDIDQMVTPGTCSVAINTKGTGADKGRVVTTTTPDSVVTDLTVEFTNSLLMPALMKAKEKANRTKCSSNLRYQSPVANNEGELSVDSAGAGLAMTADSDGDGLPEGEISQIVLPSTSSMAINQKGTGAEKNRVISTASDSSVVQTLSITQSGSSEPQSEIESSIMPGTCSVAINTKGTGADRNRTIGSSVDDSGAVHYLDMDDDNDGLVDRSIVSSVDASNAQVVLTEGPTEVALRTKGGGVIKGAININHGSALRVSLDADGNGYLSNALGIGVTPTHHIDVAGGAYCDGTNWVNASDANVKENFRSVDGEQILEKLEDLEISQWNYKGESGMDHIGPTAQDFKRTFGVGSDGKSISTIDPSGIALAAIQELYTQLKQKDQKLDDQAKLILELQEKLAKIEKQLKKQ